MYSALPSTLARLSKRRTERFICRLVGVSFSGSAGGQTVVRMNTCSFRDLFSTVAMSFRLAGTQSTLKRAANIHSHHLTFIGRASSDVRQCLYFFGRGISGTREGRRFSGRTNKSSLGGTGTDWPLGRGTDGYTNLADSGLLKPVPNRHPNRWPVVGTT